MKTLTFSLDRVPDTIARTFQAAPLAVGMLILAMVAQAQAAPVTWNLDPSKTKTVLLNGNTGEEGQVANDPIDLGAWGNAAYLPIPYFAMKLTGYDSGADIASVDSFSITASNMTVPVGAAAFNADLYVWTGSPGNPWVFSTGDVTMADWQWPNLIEGKGTLLQASFIPQGSSPGTFSLDSGGKAALLSYLQNNYVTGDYIIFTMRMSALDTGSEGLLRLGAYDQISGALQTTAVSYASWAANNAGGQVADLDYDQDGVSNGVEYFMNAAPGFTANPALFGGTVTWPNGGKIPSDAYGSQFQVQKSTDLANWSAVASDDINLSNTAGALTWKVASISNGNMDSFPSNLPSSWGVSGGTLTSAPSADNSPFTNKFADNGSSWIIDDSTDTTGAAGFLQFFSNKTNYQSITVNFDFMVPTLTANQNAGAWGIQFDGDGVASRPQAASSSVHYRIDRNGNFSINNSAGITDIVALEANSWYNVQATFQVTANNTSGTNGAGYQSGKITKWGGASTSWNNVALINTTQGFSRLLVRDRSTSSTGSLLLDNVSVAPQGKEFVRLKVTPN